MDRCSTTQRVRLADQTGTALFGVILLTALILSLGIFGARTSQIEVAIAGNDLQAKRALEIAEAGISHAFNMIEQKPVVGLNAAADGFDDELSGGGTNGALTAIGNTTTVNGETYRFRHFGGAGDEDGYYVRAIDNEDETNGLNDASTDVDGRIHLVSRGRAGRAERVIEAILQREPPFQCVLCGAQNIPLLPSVTIVGALSTDSFDSDVAPYNVGTATASGNIQSNGGISIDGAAPVDIRGSVTASDIVALQNSPLTGVVTQNAPPVTYAPVAPCGPPYPPNPGITGGSYDQALGTLVNAGPMLALAPGDYCFSSITMTGVGSTLHITGPTRIYLTLPSTILGVLNTTNVASNLRIFSSVTSPVPPLPVVPAMRVVGGVNVAMAIYAPNAVVDLAGINDFYGSIVAAVLPNVGITRLHFDQELQNPPVELAGWRELRNYMPD